jgi:uncharacterized lipoprotein
MSWVKVGGGCGLGGVAETVVLSKSRKGGKSAGARRTLVSTAAIITKTENYPTRTMTKLSSNLKEYKMNKLLSESARSVTIHIWLISVILGSIILTGCTTYLVPMNYSPSSVKNATGALIVSEFKYLPSESSVAKPFHPNRIRSTAIGGDLLIDREVKTYVRDAVFAELRSIGVKTNDSSKVLSGDIEEFSVNNIGFNIDLSIRIKYTLTDASTKKVIFQSVRYST